MTHSQYFRDDYTVYPSLSSFDDFPVTTAPPPTLKRGDVQHIFQLTTRLLSPGPLAPWPIPNLPSPHIDPVGPINQI